MKEAITFLNNLVEEHNTCILALSGGPDSMCLLNLLLKLREKKEFSIVCVHINHNTRKSCDEEYTFIKKYLEDKNVILEYDKIETYQKGKFTENEAREKRYAYLKEIYRKYNADFLLTAHHGDDLAETIFIRILRGSTLPGYAGFKIDTVWDQVRIIRPLIFYTKKEIMKYMEEEKIPFVLDETNEEDNIIRNRIRHHLLPFLEKEDPNYVEKILHFSQSLNQANNILLEKIEEQKKLEVENKIKLKDFLQLTPEFQEYYLKDYFRRIYDKDLPSITNKHIEYVLKFIRSFKETGILDLPKGYVWIKERNEIYLQKKMSKKRYKIECQDRVILPNGGILKKESSYTEKSNYEIHLNSKEIKLPLYITTREPGMKMAVKNLNGCQKISDILINSKIENTEKDEVPILVDSNHTVLWVLGIKKSQYDLEKDENYDIIYKYIKKEGEKL